MIEVLSEICCEFSRLVHHFRREDKRPLKSYLKFFPGNLTHTHPLVTLIMLNTHLPLRNAFSLGNLTPPLHYVTLELPPRRGRDGMM